MTSTSFKLLLVGKIWINYTVLFELLYYSIDFITSTEFEKNFTSRGPGLLVTTVFPVSLKSYTSD